eukprot:jgi/Mesvir1/18866/Mv22759-RA.1
MERICFHPDPSPGRHGGDDCPGIGELELIEHADCLNLCGNCCERMNRLCRHCGYVMVRRVKEARRFAIQNGYNRLSAERDRTDTIGRNDTITKDIKAASDPVFPTLTSSSSPPPFDHELPR